MILSIRFGAQLRLACCLIYRIGSIIAFHGTNASPNETRFVSVIANTGWFANGNPSNTLRALHTGAALIGNQENVVDWITITLPGIGDETFSRRSYELIGSRVKGIGVAHKVWIGDFGTSINIDGSVSFSGDATIVLLPNGDLTCSVQVGARRFKCQPCSLSKISVQEISSCVDIYEIDATFSDDISSGIGGRGFPPATRANQIKRFQDSQANDQSPSSVLLGHDKLQKRNLIDDGSVIDILFLYTAQSVEYYGSEDLLLADLALNVAKSNKVLSNSLVDLEIQVVSWQQTDYVEEGNSFYAVDFIWTDLGVAKLRDEVGADFVIIISTDPSDYYFCIDMYGMYGFVDSDSGLASIQTSCLGLDQSPLLVILGLQFGCNYSKYGYAYQSKDCSFHTILSSPCENSILIPFYSNPNLRWASTGELLGSADTSDCSRVMSEQKLIFSQFRDTVSGMTLPTNPATSPTAAKAPIPLPAPLWMEIVGDISSPTFDYALGPTLSPILISTFSPTLISTSSPTPIPTSSPMPLPSLTPPSNNPTYAPTALSSLVPMPTVGPTDTIYPNDGKIYFARFKSRLINQELWTEQMEGVFASIVKSIVISTVGTGDIAFESANESIYDSSSGRALVLSHSIEASYKVLSIPGYAAALTLSNTLIAQSENGVLVDRLQLNMDMFDNITQIITEPISDPAPQSGGSSSLPTSSILAITLVPAVVLLLALCIYYNRDKLKVYCIRTPSKASERDNELGTTSNLVSCDDAETNVNPVSDRTVSNDTSTPNILTNMVTSVMWSGLGVVASNLPYMKALFAVCDGIFALFSAYENKDENIKQVMKWITNVMSILKSLENNVKQYPAAQLSLGMNQMDQCKQCLETLLTLAVTHQENGMLLQFALSVKIQELIEAASRELDSAISSLNLEVNVSTLGVSLRIDENVSTLVSVLHDVRVDISAMAAAMCKAMSYPKLQIGLPRMILDLMASTPDDGEGPVLNETILASAPAALKQLEATQDSYRLISAKPIGIGRLAKVYRVQYNGSECAAKIVSLLDVPQNELQEVYLKFTCELYILNLLKHQRIVELRGNISNLREYTLILEYMEHGSLRKVLNESWNEVTPKQRHTILCDVAEGMAFLHRKKMHHRDLKSPNILLTKDFRAKISDFGMSRTSATVSTFSNVDELKVQSTGGTSAWMAPESFNEQKNGSSRFGDKRDVYSYGIVIWEVLSGKLGSKHSIPWRGFAHHEIVTKVSNGNRPKLHDGCENSDNVLGATTHVEIMNECLQALPVDRPLFIDILKLSKRVTEENNEAILFEEV